MSTKQSAKLFVICTGCAGSRRHEYLEQMIEGLNRTQKDDVQLFLLKEYILETAREEGFKATEDNILDMEDREREAIREKAIDRVLAERDPTKHCIVSTPVIFKWKKQTLHGLEETDVQKMSPNFYITVIDDLVLVKRTLAADPQWRRFKFTLEQLADWRESEIQWTETLARIPGGPRVHYVIARAHPYSVVADLLFRPEKKKAYFSFPITHGGGKDLREARQLVENLRPYYVLFDPLTINEGRIFDTIDKMKKKANKTGEAIPKEFLATIRYPRESRRVRLSVSEAEAAREIVNTQIVRRDFKLIDQSDAVIVHYPTKKLSTGVICEMMVGFRSVKDVWAYHPHKASPFFTYISSKVSTDFDEFFRFLVKQAKTRPKHESLAP